MKSIQQKQCSRCREYKALSEFGTNSQPPDNLNYYCRGCTRFFQKRYRTRYSEKRRIANSNYQKLHPEARKYYQIKCKYGLTRQAYDLLVETQGGLCALCGKKNESNRLSVDHDHTTGKVRGLLCGNCNRALGMLGDTVEALSRAIDYLTGEKNGCKVSAI